MQSVISESLIEAMEEEAQSTGAGIAKEAKMKILEQQSSTKC